MQYIVHHLYDHVDSERSTLMRILSPVVVVVVVSSYYYRCCYCHHGKTILLYVVAVDSVHYYQV